MCVQQKEEYAKFLYVKKLKRNLSQSAFQVAIEHVPLFLDLTKLLLRNYIRQKHFFPPLNSSLCNKKPISYTYTPL